MMGGGSKLAGTSGKAEASRNTGGRSVKGCCTLRLWLSGAR